ncbi:MAG: hypothetical protein Q4F00_01880, partial [bacterium]|nr:hypothetical protein [bacterium]
MKKSLLALSGLAVLFICNSVSAIAAPPTAYPQYSSSAVLLADAAKTAAKEEAKTKEEAPKPVLTPVKVSVSVSALNVEIDIAGKPATLGSYNPNQQKRTITISQATLAGPEQKNEIDKGLIKSVQVREIDGNKVVIDIYALGNPRIIQQAYGKKFLVSLSDMEDVAKPKAKPAAPKPQAKAASASSPEAGSKAKAASAAPKPQAKAASAASPEAGSKDKAAAAKKEAAKPVAASAAAKPGQESDAEDKAAA